MAGARGIVDIFKLLRAINLDLEMSILNCILSRETSEADFGRLL